MCREIEMWGFSDIAENKTGFASICCLHITWTCITSGECPVLEIVSDILLFVQVMNVY